MSKLVNLYKSLKESTDTKVKKWKDISNYKTGDVFLNTGDRVTCVHVMVALFDKDNKTENVLQFYLGTDDIVAVKKHLEKTFHTLPNWKVMWTKKGIIAIDWDRIALRMYQVKKDVPVDTVFIKNGDGGVICPTLKNNTDEDVVNTLLFYAEGAF